MRVLDAFSAADWPSNKKETLNIAFVTGNEMKVREIEMILAQEGAINLEYPEKSLGEPNVAVCAGFTASARDVVDHNVSLACFFIFVVQ